MNFCSLSSYICQHCRVVSRFSLSFLEAKGQICQKVISNDAVTSVTIPLKNLLVPMHHVICGQRARLTTTMSPVLLRQITMASMRDTAMMGPTLRDPLPTRRRRVATARRPCTVNGQPSTTEEIGFGFSAGGLLFPYFIGVAASLHENGLLTRTHFSMTP